jgi:Tfp pilus assembly protein PilO
MLHIGLSTRERFIFIITAIFIAIALLYNFIFEPISKKWQFMNKEIVAKKVKLNKGIKLLENKNFIIEEYNQYAKSTKNISKILGYVEHLADSLDIRTSNIKPGQGIEKGLYKEYNLEFQIEGQMPAIIKFLSELAKMPTMVILKKFDFRLISQNPSIFKGTIILSKIII